MRCVRASLSSAQEKITRTDIRARTCWRVCRVLAQESCERTATARCKFLRTGMHSRLVATWTVVRKRAGQTQRALSHQIASKIPSKRTNPIAARYSRFFLYCANENEPPVPETVFAGRSRGKNKGTALA